MRNRITYIYPIKHRVSFQFVAKKHIELLRKYGIEVQEVDEKNIDVDKLDPVTVIHPIFYILYGNHAQLLRKILKKVDHLIGFEVCDTSHITPLASYTASQFDVVVLPSTWCKEVFAKSGVMTRLEVIPHGIDDVFLRDDIEPKDEDVKNIRELKGFKVLFFLWHSGYRKGADIVANALARLNRKYHNVYLIVKMVDILDPLMRFLMFVPNTIFIMKWLSKEDLVALYDSVDLVIVPSRGGGFELNAIEALARRKPVIVSEWGSFNDYCSECIKAKTRRWVKIFELDALTKHIHDGLGCEADPIDLAEKIEYVMNNYDEVLKHYEPIFERVRREYTWDRVGEKLYNLIREFL